MTTNNKNGKTIKILMGIECLSWVDLYKIIQVYKWLLSQTDLQQTSTYQFTAKYGVVNLQ